LSWCEISLGSRGYGFGWCRKQDDSSVKVRDKETEEGQCLEALSIGLHADERMAGLSRIEEALMALMAVYRELLCVHGTRKDVQDQKGRLACNYD